MDRRRAKSEIAMLKVQLRAVELGVQVSTPVVEGSRYDCILDTGKKLLRAQVKYAGADASNSSGAVHVNLTKAKGRGANRPYQRSEIDILLLYLPAVDRVCLIPPKVFDGKSQLILRYAPPKNGYKKCLLAEKHFW